jgi:hypothetical protein
VTDDQSVLGRAYLPYHDGIFWLEADENLARGVQYALDLCRLFNVRQLSLLGYPVCQARRQMGHDFTHNRHIHTSDVYAIGLLLAHNLGVVGDDLTALRLALLIHDGFTPAGGDAMKFVDKDAFDEDARLSELLDDEAWIELCVRCGVFPELPIRICQEKDGLLAQIRDLADTLAYVSRDLHQLAGFTREKYVPAWHEDDETRRLAAVLGQIASIPNAFTLWESVRRSRDGRSIVVENHRRLETFLRARALLFRLLYYNRQARNVEYIIGIRLVQELMKDGLITVDDCIRSRGKCSIDELLWHFVEEQTGYNPDHWHRGQRGMTDTFQTLPEAKQNAMRWTTKHHCAIIYRWPSATKTKTSSWLVEKGGVEMPWSEAYPNRSADIESIMHTPTCYWVARIHRDHLSRLRPAWWKRLHELACAPLS